MVELLALMSAMCLMFALYPYTIAILIWIFDKKHTKKYFKFLMKKAKEF